MQTIPDFLVIGHMCYDVTPDGFKLGGAASFCSQVALEMGKSVGVLTSTEKNFRFQNLWEKMEVVTVVALENTIFENIYHGNSRTQYLHQIAATIEVNHLPDKWQKIPIVLFGPIADEVSFDLLNAFPDSLLAASPQGWLRNWGTDKKIKPKNIDWNQLSKLDIVIVSEEDIIGFEFELPRIADLVEILIVTRGEMGSQLYFENELWNFPACSSKVVDLTGAGDVFTVSFLLNYAEKKNVFEAMAFANVAAAISIEGIGIQKLPTRTIIEQRLVEYLEKIKPIQLK